MENVDEVPEEKLITESKIYGINLNDVTFLSLINVGCVIVFNAKHINFTNCYSEQD